MSTAQFPASVLIVPMPIPRSQGAPHFDGKYVTDFLNLIKQHGANAGIVDDNDLVPYILQYSSDRVKDLIRYSPEFDPDETGKTWQAAKSALTLLYGYAEETPDYSETMLRDFCQESAAKSPFTSTKEIETYLREFAQVAGPLLKKSKITKVERDFYFVTGIPSEMKDWFTGLVPDANRKRSSPPSVEETVKILRKRFDTDSLTYEPWKEMTDRKERQVSFDSDGNRQDAVTLPAKTPAPARAPTPNSIEDLALQLEKMHLNMAALLGTKQQTTQTSQVRPPAAAGQKTCFMCGKAGEHPLHPSRCPETRFLLDAQIIKYDTNRNRYVMKDGADLPIVPRGFLGGVADYIRAKLRDHDAQPATIRTSAIGLSYGTTQVLNDENFAVSSLDVLSRNTDPVTRTGKDTNVRFDPTRRPESKGKEREAPPHQSTSNPKPSAPAPAPANSPAPKVPLNNPAPPPNPINRKDGWKDSRPSNSKPRDEDVVMQDAKKPAQSDKYHITSSLQERADANSIFENLLKVPISLPLFEILGVSPQLQKLFSDATRAKREYSTKQAEYLLDNVDTETFTPHRVRFEESHPKRIYAESAEGLDDFLVKYSNAIAKLPEGRYYAMSTGTLMVTVGNVELKAMIDSESELNLASKSVPARCNLAVDFEGTKWALKGIHGLPEQLRGCATDVPMRIGRHDFSHHLFVSHQELGPQDLILGQPFLQWFAARLDYERTGGVSMYLWKDGDRKVNPTIVISITDPNDSRNTTAISRNHEAHQAAWMEEVTDEEDFYS